MKKHHLVIIFFLMIKSVNAKYLCEEELRPYAEINAGKNLIDLTKTELLIFNNQEFSGKPDYLFSNKLGLLDAKNLDEKKYYEGYEEYFQERVTNWKKWKDSNDKKNIYFPLVQDSKLPIILHQFNWISNCYKPYLKFEELVMGGFKIKLNNKFYYVKDVSKFGPSSLVHYYLSDSVEKAWTKKLKSDVRFLSAFEKIKHFVLTKDEKEIRSIMEPDAEKEIQSLYRSNLTNPDYMKFFYYYACNSLNINEYYTTVAKREKCDEFSIMFPLVTYRPFGRSNSRVTGPTVFVRVTSTTWTKNPRNDDDAKKNPYWKYNQYGDLGLVLGRVGDSWRIKDIFLDNNTLTDRMFSKMPDYWGRKNQYLYAYPYTTDQSDLWGESLVRGSDSRRYFSSASDEPEEY